MSNNDTECELERERDEAKAIIVNLLAINTFPTCENLHHPKKDRHELGEDCPAMKRANGYIDSARSFLTKNQ